MPKYKLSLEDLESPIESAFGIHSSLGPLSLCYELNALDYFKFQRHSEDLYQDFKQSRFFYPIYSCVDPLREIEWKLVANRSYRSESSGPQTLDLFGSKAEAEKNWLNAPEGFNFFLWFEGENQKVSFLHEVQEKLKRHPSVSLVKALSESYLNRLNKNQKYYHGL